MTLDDIARVSKSQHAGRTDVTMERVVALDQLTALDGELARHKAEAGTDRCASIDPRSNVCCLLPGRSRQMAAFERSMANLVADNLVLSAI